MHSVFQKEASNKLVCLCQIQCVLHLFISNKLFAISFPLTNTSKFLLMKMDNIIYFQDPTDSTKSIWKYYN